MVWDRIGGGAREDPTHSPNSPTIWNDVKRSMNVKQERFAKAVAMAGQEFTERVRYTALAWLPARDIVKAAILKRTDFGKQRERGNRWATITHAHAHPHTHTHAHTSFQQTPPGRSLSSRTRSFRGRSIFSTWRRSCPSWTTRNPCMRCTRTRADSGEFIVVLVVVVILIIAYL